MYIVCPQTPYPARKVRMLAQMLIESFDAGPVSGG
jgi:hypothetical protein